MLGSQSGGQLGFVAKTTRKRRRNDNSIDLPQLITKETKKLINRLPFKGPKRTYTISVALPVSIAANCQSQELRSYLVAQIARTLTVFGVDEIIVFEDAAGGWASTSNSKTMEFFVRNLEYLETPQYLRRLLFPMHPFLKFAGLQNPLDAPHHLRRNEMLPFREGAVLEKSDEMSCYKKNRGSFVECGLQSPIWIPEAIKPGVRVTVKIEQDRRVKGETFLRGTAVSPEEPSVSHGIYWGYRVRACHSWSEIFECPFSTTRKFDLTVGTSERGDCVGLDFQLPSFRHMLIVLGGLGGIEEAVQSKQGAFEVSSTVDPRPLFNLYLNTCPFQRSRTIRTEEALPITLAALHAHILNQGRLHGSS